MATQIVTIGSGVGRDYPTVAAALAAAPSNFTAEELQLICEMYADSEFAGGFVVPYKNTSALYNIIIRAAAGHSFMDNLNVRTNALFYTPAYGVAITEGSTGTSTIEISAGYTEVHGLQVQGVGRRAVTFNSGATGIARNCVFTGSSRGLFVNISGFVGENLLLVATGGNNSHAFGSSKTDTKLFSVTAICTGSSGTRYPIWMAEGALECRNVAAFGGSKSFHADTGTISGSNNASWDDQAPGTSSLIDLDIADQFANAANDFRLKAGSALIDAGGTYGPVTDISGVSRPIGDAYDIGAWEYGEAAPPTPPTGTITSQPAPDGQAQRFIGTTTDATSGSYTLTGSNGGVTVGPLPFEIEGDEFDFVVEGLVPGDYAPTLTVTGPGGTAGVTGASAFSIVGVDGGGEIDPGTAAVQTDLTISYEVLESIWSDLVVSYSVEGTADTKTATITLVDVAGAAGSNLTGLKWAWFDQATPDLFGSPADSGTAEVTDANGTLTIELTNSSLTSGQAGWLIVTNSDGNPETVHKAFSGPVVVD